MKLNEDQIAQLLSAFWVQANLPDNLPSNIEAIAHSFSLTLISSRLMVMPFFFLPPIFPLSFKVLDYRNLPSNAMQDPSQQLKILQGVFSA